MPLIVSISDDKLTGLSPQAKQELSDGVTNFAEDLISESNRLELGRRGASGVADVSANDVRDALPIVRRREASKKATVGDRFIRGGAVAFGIILGLVWDKESLQDGVYLLLFFPLFAVTLILGTLAAVRD